MATHVGPRSPRLQPIDPISGAPEVAVVATPKSSTISAAGPFTIGTSPEQLLAANPNRLRLQLQNCGTSEIFILFGVGVPSSSNYHICLRPGGTSNDGSSLIYEDTIRTEAVQAVSSANGGSITAHEDT